jgi:hypothetical protein
MQTPVSAEVYEMLLKAAAGTNPEEIIAKRQNELDRLSAVLREAYNSRSLEEVLRGNGLAYPRKDAKYWQLWSTRMIGDTLSNTFLATVIVGFSVVLAVSDNRVVISLASAIGYFAALGMFRKLYDEFPAFEARLARREQMAAIQEGQAKLAATLDVLRRERIPIEVLQTTDQLFEVLCAARNRLTPGKIRLMQIRRDPPVVTDSEGNLLDKNRKPIGIGGTPEFRFASKPAMEWYSGMESWCKKLGNEAERITNVFSKGKPNWGMLLYAQFVDRIITEGWNTIGIDWDVKKPTINLCIFGAQEAVVTFDHSGGATMTGLHVKDPAVTNWLVTHYDKMRGLEISAAWKTMSRDSGASQ